uniref:Bulb-type lectin domain-containing protein n=1 Tax=Fagus sylvatica TaxID=28930 RepID=A0A2N9G5P1_FAGSY
MEASGHKRYVGIWYTRDKQTVVWVANRDQPLINATGAFGSENDSYLKLVDTSSGESYWSLFELWCGYCSDPTLTLTDSGNLVAYREDKGKPVWESFKNPTDTFLPGMSMDSNLNLTSWRDRDDPGRGNFTFSGDKKTLIIDKEGMIYWKSVDYGQLPLSNGLYFAALLGYNYARLVMHFSGKLEYWDQSYIGTPSLIQAEPSNNCSRYNFCGKFGSCNPNNKLACKCLPGFIPNVPQKWHSGDFSDGCVRNSIFCGDNDTFLSLKMMVVGENPNQNPVDLVHLQEEHHDGNNLFVRVAISDIEQTVRNCKPCGTNMIPYPLSTSSNCGDPMYFSFDCDTTSGQVSFKAPSGTYRVTGIDPNTRMFLIQVKGGGNPWLNQSLPFNLTSPRNSSSKISSEVTDDVEIVWEPPLEPICNLPADCKDWPYSTCKSARDGKRRHVQDLIDAGEFNEEDEKGIDVPFYDLESILVATDNFSNENKLGQGGYGPVFKGKLPSGQEIAVKRLSSVSSQGLQEFKNEVAWRLWTDNKMLDLMDETLRETCIADQFVKCINIGLLCVQDDPSDRPTMSNVIKMLDSEITNLPTPKQPAFFITRDQSSSTFL